MIRESVLPLPEEMVGRPVDHRGFPVPWFVTRKTEEGLWDFVHVDPNRITEAVKHRKCFVSGEKMGKFVAFVVGPMCTITRISSDAPVKPNIAEWSARVCPFLTRPSAVRPKWDENSGSATPGFLVPGNPGICAIWVTTEFRYQRNRLFTFGEPDRVLWFREGRPATVAEVREGFDAGYERLKTIASEDGPEAIALLNRMTSIAREFLPC